MAKKDVLKAEFEGVLKIGDRELSCAVLEDGTRVFSMRGLNRALGSGRTGTKPQAVKDGALKLPPILASKGLQSYIGADLAARLAEPIEYQPKHGGRTAHGYEATLLPEICYVFVDANRHDSLRTNQMHLAEAAEILVRGFARVGIVALVDEATGYQDIRAKRALAEILEKFITKELQPWTRRFPEEFYQQIFRLRGWPYDPTTVKRPSVIGKMTNDLIYERLAPGVLNELRRKNPPTDKGHRRHRHHQWFTEDVGHPRLREHLHAVVALMKASSTWDQFKRSIERVFTKYGDTIPLPLDD